MFFHRKIITFAILCLGASASAETQAIHVIAETPALAAIAHALLPETAEITTAIEPGQSPHHFHLKPSQIAEFENVDLFIGGGAQSSPAIWSSITKLNPDTPAISVEDVLGDDYDLHYWTSPRLLINLTNALAPLLLGEDADPAPLADALAEIDMQLSETKFEQRLILGHDAFDPFTTAYDVPVVGALADEHDHSSGGASMAELDEHIEAGGAECLILDRDEMSESQHEFAQEHGLETATIDLLGLSFQQDNQEPSAFFEDYFAQLKAAFANCKT